MELVNQKIAELSSVRGRRGAKRQKNIETLELLSGVCVSEELGRLRIEIMFGPYSVSSWGEEFL